MIAFGWCILFGFIIGVGVGILFGITICQNVYKEWIDKPNGK